MHEAETKLMLNLEDRLREVLKYVLFLSDYTLLSSVEIKTNNSSFQWFVGNCNERVQILSLSLIILFLFVLVGTIVCHQFLKSTKK